MEKAICKKQPYPRIIKNRPKRSMIVLPELQQVHCLLCSQNIGYN